MANDLFRDSSEDESRIDLNSDADLAGCSERWKVSKEELRLIGGFTPAGPTS